jgi:hypothetical protein
LFFFNSKFEKATKNEFRVNIAYEPATQARVNIELITGCQDKKLA